MRNNQLFQNIPEHMIFLLNGDDVMQLDNEVYVGFLR
jgi:hypothetical protein